VNGTEPLEIERKYLIRRPAEETLRRESTERIDITQTYLLSGPAEGTRRVRHSRRGDGETWYYTEKLRLSERTRIEREREISPAEAAGLLARADGERRPIEKTRWRVPYAGHTLEIDVFPFWTDRAFCEVELEREDEAVSLPPWITVLKEVTGDPRYTNSALAREIPMDTLEEL